MAFLRHRNTYRKLFTGGLKIECIFDAVSGNITSRLLGIAMQTLRGDQYEDTFYGINATKILTFTKLLPAVNYYIKVSFVSDNGFNQYSNAI